MGVFCLLLVLAMLLRLGGSRFLPRMLVFVGIVILVTASVPRVAQYAAGYLERQYPPVPVAALPRAEVAVMLGGVLALPRPPRIRAELVGSSDRLLHVYRIARQGKADRIYLVGGNVYDGYFRGRESEFSRLMLREWGMPESRMEIGNISRTTHQNALEARDYLAEKGYINNPVILVTSALHMPRAVETFQTAGIRVIPAATDVLITEDTEPSVFNWIPSAAALQLTTRALHEIIGLQYYRWRGWARPDGTP